MTGGEALNSAIVLSRLGLRVQLDGSWIGDTPVGERLIATIRNYDIDAQRLRVESGCAGAREIVFSDERSRTIFGNYVDLLSTSNYSGIHIVLEWFVSTTGSGILPPSGLKFKRDGPAIKFIPLYAVCFCNKFPPVVII